MGKEGEDVFKRECFSKGEGKTNKDFLSKSGPIQLFI